MSQRCVEYVIGRLATDEAYRRSFRDNPEALLDEVNLSGCKLTAAEREALLATDPDLIARFADALDPRIQKCDLGGGLSRD